MVTRRPENPPGLGHQAHSRVPPELWGDVSLANEGIAYSRPVTDGSNHPPP